MLEHLTEYHMLSLEHSRTSANKSTQSVTGNGRGNEESTRCSTVPLLYLYSQKS
jgi:hypothetical protein